MLYIISMKIGNPCSVLHVQMIALACALSTAHYHISKKIILICDVSFCCNPHLIWKLGSY